MRQSLIAQSEIGYGVYETAEGWLEMKKARSRSQISEPGLSDECSNGRNQSKIWPNGLRSFDREDADFFLELLPGPYDRDGLPDSISSWKVRIDGTDLDRTFPVGMIYGPSGSGKSSLIKAGLLPRLPDHVLPVYAEATAGETESQLLEVLRKRCTDFPTDLGLAESVVALRQDLSLASGKKVLLVIDQFEQWLVARHGQSSTGLVKALRHCDEKRVQAILLVRDDYLSAAIQFMEELGVEFRPSRNARRIDLFGRPHAKKVLAAFGQSLGVLGDDLTPEQQLFLNQAVDGLATGEVVIPVRLALFVEMLKSREWSPRTLKEIGGAEGVGAAFLEETFSSGYADPRHRVHREAARSILKSLLPEGGEDIKGPRRSRGELVKASGYESRPSRFAGLIAILDGELRLITPTDSEGKDSENPTSQANFFQLTHDYLIPSIKEWISKNQRSSFRGRVELAFEDRYNLWRHKQQRHYLPGLFDTILYTLLINRSILTQEKRKYIQEGAILGAVTGLLIGV